VKLQRFPYKPDECTLNGYCIRRSASAN